jgi:hypothetical protein
MLSSHPRLGLLSGLFPPDINTKPLYAPLLPHICHKGTKSCLRRFVIPVQGFLEHSDSYSTSRLESWSVYWKHWLRFIFIFLILSSKMPKLCLKLDTDHFLKVHSSLMTKHYSTI